MKTSQTTFDRSTRSVPRGAAGSLFVLVLGAGLSGLPPAGLAADQTWNTIGFTDGNWNVSSNWVGGAVPGAATGSTSGDTATFNGGANLAVTIDASRNIKNITFDTASAGAFTFAGGPLTLTNAGAITLTSTVAATQTFNNNFLGSPNSTATGYSFLNNSATAGVKLDLLGNITGQMTASTETFTFGGSNDGTMSGNITNGSGGGNVAVTKSGAGTWTLSGGGNTYTGTTTLSGGTLVLSGGNNRLPTATSVNFSGAATLDVGSTSQTLARLTVANGVTGTVNGVGGSLLLGANPFSLGSTTVGSTQTLNLSGLATFSFSSPGNTFIASGQATSSTGSNAVLTLAADNAITASAIFVGSIGSSSIATGSRNTGTVNLGQVNVLNTATLQVGAQAKSFGTLKFNTGLSANPSLTLRGVTGGSSRADVNLGANSSGSNSFTSVVDLTTGYTGGTTLDAMIGTLSMANSNRGAGGGGGVLAAFSMGGGTLDATTIILSQTVAGNDAAASATGTFTLGVTGGAPGGTVRVENLVFVQRVGLGTMNATLNLNNGGVLAAKTVTGDAGAGTRTFTWNDGTVRNYDAASDLVVNSGLTTLNLAGTGRHAFEISAGRQGTVHQVMSGSGALTKAGDGSLTLTAANSYAGATVIEQGMLVASGGNAIPDASDLLLAHVASARFQLGDNETINSLASTGGGASGVDLQGFTLTVGRTGVAATTQYEGSISGAGSLVKANPGTLTLAGANTYGGATVINAGVLQFTRAVSLYNNTPASWTADNITVASGAVLALNVGGAGEFTDADVGTIKALGGGSNGFLPGSTLALDTTGAAGGDFTLSAPITNPNGGANALGLTKLGANTLTLTGASSHTGATTINAGTLALAGGDDRLPATGTVQFSGNGTLDVGSTRQTLADLKIAPGLNAAVTGTGGTLALGAGPFLLGDQAVAGNTTLDMSGLGTMTYLGAANTFQVTSGQAASTTAAYDSTMKFAANTRVTALSFIVGGVGTANSASISKNTVNLGQTTVINADTIKVGYARNQGTLNFQSGLTAPTLTLRGTDGLSRVGVLYVGEINSGGTTLRNSTLDTTPGVLDALVGTLIVGYNTRTGSATTPNNASLLMGTGVLDATSITLARDIAGSTGGAMVVSGAMAVAGGTVKVGSMVFADRINNTLTGAFTLDGGGTLQAQTIQPGAGTATRTFTWNDGTIKNYDAGTDLTIGTGLTTFNLAGAGLHAFEISSGRQGVVSQALTGTGALTKTGTGVLTLNAANTYSGPTLVREGGLLLEGTVPSGGLIQVSAGASLGGGGQGGGTTLEDDSILAPGGLVDDQLDLASLTLADHSVLRYDLGTPLPSGETAPSYWYDFVAVAGALTLNGKLQISARTNGNTDFGVPVAGDRWLLMTYSPGNLTDNGLVVDTANSAPLSPGLTYAVETDDVQGGVYLVVAVPEPGTGILAVLGLLLLRRRAGASLSRSRESTLFALPLFSAGYREKDQIP